MSLSTSKIEEVAFAPETGAKNHEENRKSNYFGSVMDVLEGVTTRFFEDFLISDEIFQWRPGNLAEQRGIEFPLIIQKEPDLAHGSGSFRLES